MVLAGGTQLGGAAGVVEGAGERRGELAAGEVPDAVGPGGGGGS
jgi:hypothetical protein